jgi:hypothetical protein
MTEFFNRKSVVVPTLSVIMSVGVKVGYCFGVGLIIVIARVDIF